MEFPTISMIYQNPPNAIFLTNYFLIGTLRLHFELYIVCQAFAIHKGISLYLEIQPKPGIRTFYRHGTAPLLTRLLEGPSFNIRCLHEWKPHSNSIWGNSNGGAQRKSVTKYDKILNPLTIWMGEQCSFRRNRIFMTDKSPPTHKHSDENDCHPEIKKWKILWH